MAIVSTDIKYYKSDGTDSAGGAISATEVVDNTLNNLFDDVSGDEAAAGLVDYRKIFAKNEHASLTWQDVKVWISSLTTSADDEIDVSLSTNLTGSNATGDGQSYVRPTSKVHADVLSVGDLAASGYVDIWIRRTVGAGASAATANEATINSEGDTAA